MVALYAGGGPARIFSPAGTVAPVQGFRALSGAIYGARLSTALAGTFVFRAIDGGAALLLQAAQTIVMVTAAGIAYVPGSLDVLKTTVVQATSAAMAYTGQAVSAGSNSIIQAIAGSITYAGQGVSVNVSRVVQVTARTVAYAGQGVSVSSSRFIQVIAGAIAYVARDVTLLRQYRAFVTVASKTYVPILVNSYNIVASTYVGFISRVSNYLGIRF